MDDLLSFLSSAELGIVALVAFGLLASWARLFPDLKTKTGSGIVAFELPRTAQNARAIRAAWQAKKLEGAAHRAIALDWFFIPMYVVLLACAGVLAARAAEALGGLEAGAAETVAAALVIAAVVAGVLDVLENLGMKRLLGEEVEHGVALATTVVSAAKWLLLGTVLLATVVVLPLIGLLG